MEKIIMHLKAEYDFRIKLLAKLEKKYKHYPRNTISFTQKNKELRAEAKAYNRAILLLSNEKVDIMQRSNSLWIIRILLGISIFLLSIIIIYL